MLNSTIYHSLTSATSPADLNHLAFTELMEVPGWGYPHTIDGREILCVGRNIRGLFCDSHIRASYREAGGAAAAAEKDKLRKYTRLDRSYVFQPIALETCGSIGPYSLCFLPRLKSATGEP